MNCAAGVFGPGRRANATIGRALRLATMAEERRYPEAGALMPQTSTGSYDVRDVIKAICDDGEMLELRARWAPNVVTALTSVGGFPIGRTSWSASTATVCGRRRRTAGRRPHRSSRAGRRPRC